MAFLEYKNVRIAGIAAGVPKHVIKNVGKQVQSNDYDAAAFVEQTGVAERHVTGTLTTSDLGYLAAERLIADLNWKKEEIEAIIFVSQTADYIYPASACILQERLHLSKECYAADVALGCSGWVYGLSYVASLLGSGTIKKALLIAGDAKGRFKSLKSSPLFGSASTCTAVEYKRNAKGLQFHFGTDGSGYDAIIIPDGGSRNRVTGKSFRKYVNEDGIVVNRLQGQMKGMDVFSFGISTAPKSIKKLSEHFGFDYFDKDYYVFHQANMKMNNTIVKKLKLDPAKVPSCMYHFGNTSSASIPLTIVAELRGKIENVHTKFLCCGFGVGLSWGTVAFETDKIVVSELVLAEEQKGESQWV